MYIEIVKNAMKLFPKKLTPYTVCSYACVDIGTIDPQGIRQLGLSRQVLNVQLEYFAKVCVLLEYFNGAWVSFSMI